MNWTVSKDDRKKINEIAKRVVNTVDYPDDLLTLEMDLTACHANGNPLDLDALGDAVHDLPDQKYALDVLHDVYGIRRHINRNNGKLEDCFVPRFSKAEAE